MKTLEVRMLLSSFTTCTQLCTLLIVYFLSTSGCRTAQCDLVFILDGSWSVEDVNFEIVKRWLVNITTSFNVGQKFTQVGVVQYSDSPHLEIPLGKHSTNKDLIRAMESIEYRGGNTRTGTAIEFATDRLFGLSERGQAGISRIAVVLTDGKSQDEVVKAAEAARKKGVILFAIGVGSETEMDELRAIANKPFSTYVFSVEDYKAISRIMQVIRQKLCEGKPLLIIFWSTSVFFFQQNDDVKCGQILFSCQYKCFKHPA